MKKLISRRNFLKVCALAGSAAALSACGGGKSTGSNNSAAAAVDVTGAVTFPLSEKVTFSRITFSCSLNSYKIPVSGTMISGCVSTPSFFSSKAAPRMARVCI